MISQNIKTLVALKVEKDLADLNEVEAPRIYAPADETQFSSVGIIPNEEGELVKVVNTSGTSYEIVEIGQSFRKVNKKKVKRIVAERIEALKAQFIPTAEQEDFFITKDSIKELEHQVSVELLPETEVDEQSHYVIHDTATDFLFITNTNKKGSEDITFFLRSMLGTFPAEELTDEDSFASSFKKVIVSGQTGNRLEFGDYILMIDPLSKGKAMFSKELITSDEVVGVLEDKVVSSIGLGYDGVVNFTLNSDLSFKGVKFDKEIIDNEATLIADAVIVVGELIGTVKDILEITE
ncbi:MAG: hypothetical protein [Caudoviricetes sp.]|nr:MAG: hypothetical protein [Caudoviricetes sp.]